MPFTSGACHATDKLWPFESVEQGVDELVLPTSQCDVLLISGFVDVKHRVATMSALFTPLRWLVSAKYGAQNIGAGCEH